MNERKTWHTYSQHQYEGPLAHPFLSALMKEMSKELLQHHSTTMMWHLTRGPYGTLFLSHVKEAMRKV